MAKAARPTLHGQHYMAYAIWPTGREAIHLVCDREAGVPWIELRRLRLYIGSLSASPTACPMSGNGQAGIQNDRLGAAQWT